MRARQKSEESCGPLVGENLVCILVVCCLFIYLIFRVPMSIQIFL